MKFPAAGAVLLAMLKDGSSEEKILAIKAVVLRQVPGANEVPINNLTSDDAAVSREAIKSLYFTATIDDLKSSVAKAAATKDAVRKNSLDSIYFKIATRIGNDEARACVKKDARTQGSTPRRESAFC